MTTEIDELKDAIIIEYFNYGMSDYAKLILPPGKLCILKGENNNGKSCLFYGLEWLLLNDPLAKTLINNKSLEKDKHAELKVRITKNDYFIEIIRSMTNISYNINGKLHDKKLNKQNIFEVDENVQVPGFIYVKNCIYSLFNMHGEDRGLFPISENNDQAIYTLFESLLGLINSKKILTAANKDISESTTQYQMLDAENKRLTNKITKLNSCLENVNIENIEKVIANIEYLEPEIIRLTQNKDALSKLAKIKDIEIPNKIACTELQQVLQIQQQYQRVKHSLNIALNQLAQLQNKEIKQIDYSKVDLCKRILEKLIETKKAIENHREQINSYLIQAKEYETLKQKLEQQWETIKVCPMCGQPIH